jgi:hypothetical protein
MINVIPVFKYCQTDMYEGIEAIHKPFPDQPLGADLKLVVQLISFTSENEIATTNAWGSGWFPVSVLILWVTENCVVPPRNRTPDSSFG